VIITLSVVIRGCRSGLVCTSTRRFNSMQCSSSVSRDEFAIVYMTNVARLSTLQVQLIYET